MDVGTDRVKRGEGYGESSRPEIADYEGRSLLGMQCVCVCVCTQSGVPARRLFICHIVSASLPPHRGAKDGGECDDDAPNKNLKGEQCEWPHGMGGEGVEPFPMLLPRHTSFPLFGWVCGCGDSADGLLSVHDGGTPL